MLEGLAKRTRCPSGGGELLSVLPAGREAVRSPSCKRQGAHCVNCVYQKILEAPPSITTGGLLKGTVKGTPGGGPTVGRRTHGGWGG